jgi:transcriptional regulator with XRE-family HTH domain
MGKRVAAARAAEVEVSFGERPAELRKGAGFTQIEFANVLGVSVDELSGCAPERKLVKQGDSRLRRRLLTIEKLNVAEKRQVLQIIDAFIERGHSRHKTESRA